MYRTIRVYIDEKRRVRPLENIKFPPGKKALMTILEPDDNEGEYPNETALLSEKLLAGDWNRVEEDRAWSNL